LVYWRKVPAALSADIGLASHQVRVHGGALAAVIFSKVHQGVDS
jgi:hypothetical protein